MVKTEVRLNFFFDDPSTYQHEFVLEREYSATSLHSKKKLRTTTRCFISRNALTLFLHLSLDSRYYSSLINDYGKDKFVNNTKITYVQNFHWEKSYHVFFIIDWALQSVNSVMSLSKPFVSFRAHSFVLDT